VKHHPRTLGVSNYTVGKLIQHAVNMMTGFSTVPLQVASIVGFVFTLFGIVFFLLGIALFGIGLLGEYLGRISQQVRQRPRYLIQAVLEQGTAEAALPQAERALADFQATLGPEHPRTLLAELTVVEALTELGRLDGLEARAGRILAGLEAHDPLGGLGVERAAAALAVLHRQERATRAAARKTAAACPSSSS